MPNVENIKKAIQVMERVKKNEEELGRKLFDLSLFQGNYENRILTALKTEEEALNACGTVCCLAGWLGVSPEFKKLGFSFNDHAVPKLGSMYTEDSLEMLLGLDYDAIKGLVYNLGNNELYYGKLSDFVTPDDVIEKLKSFIGEK